MKNKLLSIGFIAFLLIAVICATMFTASAEAKTPITQFEIAGVSVPLAGNTGADYWSYLGNYFNPESESIKVFLPGVPTDQQPYLYIENFVVSDGEITEFSQVTGVFEGTFVAGNEYTVSFVVGLSTSDTKYELSETCTVNVNGADSVTYEYGDDEFVGVHAHFTAQEKSAEKLITGLDLKLPNVAGQDISGCRRYETSSEHASVLSFFIIPTGSGMTIPTVYEDNTPYVAYAIIELDDGYVFGGSGEITINGEVCEVLGGTMYAENIAFCVFYIDPFNLSEIEVSGVPIPIAGENSQDWEEEAVAPYFNSWNIVIDGTAVYEGVVTEYDEDMESFDGDFVAGQQYTLGIWLYSSNTAFFQMPETIPVKAFGADSTAYYYYDEECADIFITFTAVEPTSTPITSLDIALPGVGASLNNGFNTYPTSNENVQIQFGIYDINENTVTKIKDNNLYLVWGNLIAKDGVFFDENFALTLGGEALTKGTDYDIYGNLVYFYTVYAVGDPVVVEFRDGSNWLSGECVVRNSAYELPTLESSGMKRFVGWKIRDDESGTVYPGGSSFTLTENIGFEAVWEYGISVGSHLIQNGEYLDNAGNVTTTAPAGGYAYYKDGVLTLNEFTYSGDGLRYEGINCLIYSEGSLEIVLMGENTLSTTYDEVQVYGIWVSNGDLTISGTGWLYVDAETYATSISVSQGSFTLNGANVSTYTKRGSYALFVEDDTVLNGGYLCVIAASSEGVVTNGNVTINGTNVILSAPGRALNCRNFTMDSGSLTSVNSINSGYNVINTYKFTLNGGTVTLKNENGYGLQAYQEIVINGGKLYIDAYYIGIRASETFTVNGGFVDSQSRYKDYYDGNYFATNVKPIIDASLSVLASTEANGALVAYDHERFLTYDRLAIGTPVTISFSAGEGSGAMADVTVIGGMKYTIPACSLTAPAGKVFVGWTIASDESGTVYLADQEITVEESITFQAKFAEGSSLSFNAGGGQGTMSPIGVPTGGTVTLPECTFTFPGNSYKGWSIGGTEYAVGDTITLESNLEAVALWTPNTYTVSFGTIEY